MNTTREDLSTQTFGLLKPISYQKGGWLCQCRCGTQLLIRPRDLKRRHIRSCGCTPVKGGRKGTHYMTNQTVWRCWANMRAKCDSRTYPGYRNVGAKGIRYCDRWKEFSLFLEDMGHPPKGKSIQRHDETKGFCKENCYWSLPASKIPNVIFGEILQGYWLRIKKNASIRHIPFEITSEQAWEIFVKQGGKCAFNGKPIKHAVSSCYHNGRTQQTASLDRIDSSKGYVIGNIQWIHKKFQKMKNNTPNQDFLINCDEVAEYQKVLMQRKYLQTAV